SSPPFPSASASARAWCNTSSGRRAASPTRRRMYSFSRALCCCLGHGLGLLPPPLWGRGGEGGGAVMHERCLAQLPPPPTPPHKGEGSTPSLPLAHTPLHTKTM